MNIKFTNNASSKLASVDLDSADLSFSVTTDTGDRFPTLSTAEDYFYCTIVDQLGNLEIVKVTDRTGDTLTVERGQDGTSARDFTVGSVVSHRFNAAAIDDSLNLTFADNTEALTGTSTNKAMSPSTNEYVWNNKSANDLAYDNSTSGLTAIITQDAIDELADVVDGIGTAAYVNVGSADSEIPTNSLIPTEVPAGCVMHYFGTSAPTGWLVRDGSSYNYDDYPSLGAILGSTFGGTGVPGGTFSVPNDMNLFDRGASSTGTVGTYQADTFTDHTHTYNRGTSTQSGFGSEHSFFNTYTSSTSGFASTGSGSETRPKNRQYLPIIKY